MQASLYSVQESQEVLGSEELGISTDLEQARTKNPTPKLTTPCFYDM
jgi:hypothetical protein